ncbi:MAG: helix-turn-helix domain-containing protein [Pseudomonadota bacterium]
MLIASLIMQITKEFGLLLFDDFSALGLANAVEPLRAANTLSGKTLYHWRYLGLGTGQVRSSSGLPVTPEAALNAASGDALMVLPSYGHRAHAHPDCLAALRAASRRFHTLAGMDTGAWLLAAAGLLDGFKATCHWDVLTELAEEFPEVTVSEDRFVIDRTRLSSGGATTTLDMMLSLIEADHGAALVHEVAALFMHGERGPRHLPLAPEPRIRAAAAYMRRNLEMPISINAVAAHLGLTRRTLEYAFRETGGPAPAQLYRQIRLSEARRLVRDTNLSVAEIAGRCGYADPAALTRAFRAAFATTPRLMRHPSSRAAAARAADGSSA